VARESYWKIWIVVVLALGGLRLLTSTLPSPSASSTPKPQQVAPSSLSQISKAPAPVEGPKTNLKPNSKSNPGGQTARSNSSALKPREALAPDPPLTPVPLSQPMSSGALVNDTTVPGLIAERNLLITPSNSPVNRSVPSDSSAREVPKSYFTLGSTKGEVLKIQGAPKEAGEYQWSYGISTVEFSRDGRVTSWTIRYGSPLRVKMLPSAGVSNTRGYFTIGSSKDEVLAVQGTPTEVGEYQWSYGISTVEFSRDGRVTSWTVRYGSPLNARKPQ
jgi:hypothetical protein